MSYRNTASAVTVPAPVCLESRAPAQSPEAIYQEIAARQCRRSEERFSRNAETDLSHGARMPSSA